MVDRRRHRTLSGQVQSVRARPPGWCVAKGMESSWSMLLRGPWVAGRAAWSRAARLWPPPPHLGEEEAQPPLESGPSPGGEGPVSRSLMCRAPARFLGAGDGRRAVEGAEPTGEPPCAYGWTAVS